jgi:chromosome segregation ATPase
MNKKENLDKLKKLCEELTDRDSQLKKNASTLWEVLVVVTEAKDHLKTIVPTTPEVELKIKECSEKLDKALDIVQQKGCKRVIHEH